MKLLIVFTFLAGSITSCGPRRDLVDFETACVGKPNRKVAVEGSIEDGTPVCNSRADSRDCSFWLKDSGSSRAILFTLKEGKAANQVELIKTDNLSNAAAKVHDAKGNVVNLKKPVVLSGKTTILVSSSMAPVCTLDDVEVSQ